MIQFEVRLKINRGLSAEKQKYIKSQIERLAEKHGMFCFDDGVTYCKCPPYKMYEDFHSGNKFVIALMHYREYFEVLEYDSYLEGIQGDMNHNIIPLQIKYYLLVARKLDSICVCGVYTNRRYLLEAYNMLVEKTGKDDIHIYCLKPDVFYGKDFIDKNDHSYENLEEVDIKKIKNPLE